MSERNQVVILQGRPANTALSFSAFAAASVAVVIAIVAGTQYIASAPMRSGVVLLVIVGAAMLRRRFLPPSIVATRLAGATSWSVHGTFAGKQVGSQEAVAVGTTSVAPTGALELAAGDGSALVVDPRHFDPATLNAARGLLDTSNEAEFEAVPLALDESRTRVHRFEGPKARMTRLVERPSALRVLLICIALELVAIVAIPRML